MTARDEELIARELLAHQELIDIRLKERRWTEVAAVVRYAQRDVPPELARTDPALYRTLREQITRFYINGAASSPWNASTHSPPRQRISHPE